MNSEFDLEEAVLRSHLGKPAYSSNWTGSGLHYAWKAGNGKRATDLNWTKGYVMGVIGCYGFWYWQGPHDSVSTEYRFPQLVEYLESAEFKKILEEYQIGSPG